MSKKSTEKGEHAPKNVSPETAKIIAKGHIISGHPKQDNPIIEDIRTALHNTETNHFTNRAGKKKD